MRKIFKFPILILTALSINSVYAADLKDPVTDPMPKLPVKALQLSDLDKKPLMEQLGLVEGAALIKIHAFLSTNVSSFNQILTGYMSGTSSIPASTISIAVNPHQHESYNPVHYALMHDFLLTVEDTIECPNRLSRIIDAFNATRPEITDKQAQFKEILCQAALTRTYMKQAEDLIAQTNAIIASVKDGTAISTRTVVEHTTDIESFKRDISLAEALLRSIYPKKLTIFSFSTITGTRRQKFTGQAKVHNIEITYANMISEGATSDPLTVWRKAFIENMLKSKNLTPSCSILTMSATNLHSG